MRTARSGSRWGGLHQAFPREQAPPGEQEPPREQNHRHVKKHNLAPTSLRAVMINIQNLHARNYCGWAEGMEMENYHYVQEQIVPFHIDKF